MRKITLVRFETGPLGTFSDVSTGTFQCVALERPAIGDHPCIDAGTYKMSFKAKKDHPINGPCYEVMNVKGRTAILWHAANWFDQLLGCFAPGRSVDDVVRKDGTKMKGITSSKDALAGLEADLEEEDCELTISWAKGVGPNKEA